MRPRHNSSNRNQQQGSPRGQNNPSRRSGGGGGGQGGGGRRGGGGGGGGQQQQRRSHAQPYPQRHNAGGGPRRSHAAPQQDAHRQGGPGGHAGGHAHAGNGHVEGLLQFAEDRGGDGSLRDPNFPLRPAKGDLIVPRNLIRDLRLRPGLLIRGTPRGRTLGAIESVEGLPPDEYADRTGIYESTALDPEPMLKLEHNPAELTTRIVDILTPVGFGQRGLIVAPPRTGKTILLQNLARGIHANYPDALLWLLLIDERPEEVTDMKRNVPGTVYASSNDNTVEKHLDLAQLVIERAKRQVEFGKDVVILLDSLTRLGRSFNVGGPSGGRTMSGGLDNRALEIPKRLFGAARKIEHGGSLTILATCLIDTGSRMDQVIFEEFKGTGNMELTLDRNLANQRIWPAINITESGTRKEEKLLDERTLAHTRAIRRHLVNMPPTQSMKHLVDALSKYPTNQALFSSMRV